MCILCNCRDPMMGNEAYETFGSAQRAMREATDKMRLAAENAATPEIRKSYDRAHKRMVRLLRDWNHIEHEREVIPATQETSGD